MTLIEFSLRIIVAVGLGACIGLERQWRQRVAGLRTNALVARSAAAFVALSSMIHTEANPTRIAAQVVSGIGFLGGGVILRDGLTVRGLTAATTLWCSTAVGTLAGSGFLGPALVAASVVVGANVLLRPWGHWIGARSRDTSEGQFVYHLEVCGPIHHEQQLQSVVLRALGGASHLTLRGVSSDRSASDSVRL